jgi:hypothetical protein
MSYNGWSNWATWTASLLIDDYGTDRDDDWQALVAEAVQTPDTVPGADLVAASDALRKLVTDEVVLAAIETMTAPPAARLYVQDVVTSTLELVHWSELVAAHRADSPT